MEESRRVFQKIALMMNLNSWISVDEYDLFVMRRAGDLRPLEQGRNADSGERRQRKQEEESGMSFL
jgi:hypothetical protein